MARSKVKSISHHDVAHLQPLINVPTINFRHLFQRYCPDKILKVKVTTVTSKVKSRSCYYVADLQPPNQCPYQVSTSYTLQFWDIAQTRFYRSRSLQQGQSSNQGQTMTLHTYTPNQCHYRVSTSYTLQFPRYSLEKILLNTQQWEPESRYW